MLYALISMITRLGVFLLTAQMLIRLRPAAKYERYLRFLVGVMALQLLLHSACTGLFSGEIKYETGGLTETVNGQAYWQEAEEILIRRTVEEAGRQAEETDGFEETSE